MPGSRIRLPVTTRITLLCIRYLVMCRRFVRMSSQVKNPMPPMIISSGIATETTGLSA